jgi:hypothetical protein
MKDLPRGDYLCLYTATRTTDQVPTAAIGPLVEQKAARLVYENSEFRVYRLIWRGRSRPGAG